MAKTTQLTNEEQVADYLNKLDHPLRKVVEALRKIILHAVIKQWLSLVKKQNIQHSSQATRVKQAQWTLRQGSRPSSPCPIN